MCLDLCVRIVRVHEIQCRTNNGMNGALLPGPIELPPLPFYKPTHIYYDICEGYQNIPTAVQLQYCVRL